MEAEVWLPCPDHVDLYEISSLGRIKRVARGKGTKPGRVLRPSCDARGYVRVSLTVAGKSHVGLIHSLVCKAFHGPAPTPKHEAAHNNGNKLDNIPSNLRWATHAENMADKNLHGTHNKGQAHILSALKDEDIPNIRRLLAEKVFQKDIAKMYGVHRCTINNIAAGKNWTHVPQGA